VSVASCSFSEDRKHLHHGLSVSARRLGYRVLRGADGSHRKRRFPVPILKDDTEVFAPYSFRMGDHPTRTQTMRVANARNNI
jgi:hypothetical protein